MRVTRTGRPVSSDGRGGEPRVLTDGTASGALDLTRAQRGVGVERTFPVHSPKIEKIEVTAIGDVNRAKLYYLRGKVGKKARVRAKRGVALPTVEAVPELEGSPEPEDAEAVADATEAEEVEAAEVERAEAPEPEPVAE